MRPLYPALAALILELCFSLVAVAADSVESLTSACLINHSNGYLVYGCSRTTTDNAELDACIADQQGDGRGGSIASVCDQMVRAQCASVGFCPTTIAGCEKFGSPVCATSQNTALGLPLSGDVDCAANPSDPSCAGGRAASPPRARPAARATAAPTGGGAGSAPTDAEVSADVRSCQTALSQASQCCNHPSSCSTSSAASAAPAPNPGLSLACQQLQQATYENARANNSAAANCSARSSGCNSACAALVSKYTNLASAGANYQTALEQGQSAQRTCGGFAAIVQRLGQQASSAASSSGAGFQCNQAAAALDPSSLGGAPSQNSNSSAWAVEDPYGCAANPTSIACQGTKMAERLDASTSAAAFAADSGASSKPNFNVEPDTVSGGGPNLPVGGEAKPPGAANVVANNSGGSIPGGGGTSPASLGGGGKGKASPGSPGYTTDVMQGDRSGGGYTQPTGSNLDEDSSAGLGGRNGGGRPLGRGLASVGGGIDLKRYLPGGALDPNRRIGALGGGRQVIGRFDDMWKNVSNRYSEKCKLGLLLDCR